MKNLILILLFIFPLYAAAQSVPNGTFENWVTVEPLEHPEFWTTDNTGLQTTVSKDWDAHEGEFAMRVTAQPHPVGEYGIAYTLFEITAIPEALNFHARWATAFGGVTVAITFLNGDQEVYNEFWQGTDSMAAYTAISIPLEQIEPEITHALIAVSALVGDFAPGTAWISVDAMDFGQPMNVQVTERKSLSLFPNPAKEQITLQTNGESLGSIFIYDMQGKLMQEAHGEQESTTINVQHLPAGLYTVVGEGYRGKFLVE